MGAVGLGGSVACLSLLVWGLQFLLKPLMECGVKDSDYSTLSEDMEAVDPLVDAFTELEKEFGNIPPQQ